MVTMMKNNDCVPLSYLDAGSTSTSAAGTTVAAPDAARRTSSGDGVTVSSPSIVAAGGGSSSSSSQEYSTPPSSTAGAGTADEDTTMIKRANNKKKASRRKSFSSSSLCPPSADDYITTDHHHTAAAGGYAAGEAASTTLVSRTTKGVEPFGNKPAAGANLLLLLKTRTAGDDNSSTNRKRSTTSSEDEGEEDECPPRRMKCCAKNSSPSCSCASPLLVYESDKGKIEKTKSSNCTLPATTFSSTTSTRSSSPRGSKNQYDRRHEQHMKKRVCTSTTCISTNKEHDHKRGHGGQNGVDMINLFLQAPQQDHVKKHRKLPEPIPAGNHPRSYAGHNFISPCTKKTTIMPVDRAEVEEGHPMTSATPSTTPNVVLSNGCFCNLFPEKSDTAPVLGTCTAKEASIAASAATIRGSISKRSTATEYFEADRQHYTTRDNSILCHLVSCRAADVGERQITSWDNISPRRVQLNTTRDASVTAPAGDATIPADTTSRKKNSGTATAIVRTTTDKTQEDSSGIFWPECLLLEQEHTLNMEGLSRTNQSWNSVLPSRKAHQEKVDGVIHHHALLGEQITTIQQRNQTLQECFVNDDSTIRLVRQEGFLESGNVSSGNDMLSTRWRSRECSQAEDKLHSHHHSVLDRMQCFYKALLPEQTKNGSVLSIKFPWKLFYILECGDYSNVCQWNPDGNAFYITNIVGFEKSVLRNIFKTEKFASFQRKLYRWNFFKCSEKFAYYDHDKQNGEKHLAYKHEQFHRGNWMQVKTIQCRTRFLSKKELETKREAKKRRNLANDVGAQEPTSCMGASKHRPSQVFLSCHDDSSSVSPDGGKAASKLQEKKVAQSSSAYYAIVDDNLLGLLDLHASESYGGCASREGLVLSSAPHVTGTKIEQDRFGSLAVSSPGLRIRTSVSGDLWDGSYCCTTPTAQHNFPVVSSSHMSSQMDEEIFRLRQENMMIAMAILRDSQQKNDRDEDMDVLLNILSQQHQGHQATSPKFRSDETNDLMNHVPTSFHTNSTFQTGAIGLLHYCQQSSIAINDNITPPPPPAAACFNANSLVAPAAGALVTSPLDIIRGTQQNFSTYELTNHNAMPAPYYNTQASSILCRMAVGQIPSYELTNHYDAIPATYYNSQEEASTSILCRMGGQNTSTQEIVMPPEDANRSQQVQQAAHIGNYFAVGSTTSFEHNMYFHKP